MTFFNKGFPGNPGLDGRDGVPGEPGLDGKNSKWKSQSDYLSLNVYQ